MPSSSRCNGHAIFFFYFIDFTLILTKIREKSTIFIQSRGVYQFPFFSGNSVTNNRRGLTFLSNNKISILFKYSGGFFFFILTIGNVRIFSFFFQFNVDKIVLAREITRQFDIKFIVLNLFFVFFFFWS